jgi:hypothetical protein
MRLQFNPFLLLLLAILIARLPVQAAQPSTDKAKLGWQLSYKVKALGRLDCLLSEDGAKITTPMFSLLVLPPDYHAVLYNPQTKKMISVKKDKVSSTFVVFGERGASKQFKFTDWHRMHDEKITGLMCQKYHRELQNAGETTEKFARYTDDFWLTTAIDIRNYRQLMEPLVSMARGHYKELTGIPVKHKKTYEEFFKGSKKPYHSEITDSLSLISAEKVLIKPSTYAVPKDYKVVADETELLFNDEEAGAGANSQSFGPH